MRLIMQPFILIYRFVSLLFFVPRKLAEVVYDFFLGLLDKDYRKKKQQKKIVQAPNISTDDLHLMDNQVQINKENNTKDKITFLYTAKNSSGKQFKGSFDGHSLDEVKTFLQNEGYEIIKIAPAKAYEKEIGGNSKLSPAELSFMLTQLSTYLKAGIPLIDAVRILAKQSVKPAKRKVYDGVVYELLLGENFSVALSKQGKKFPGLLINMIKTAELTGDLSSVLDDMAEYYTAMEQIRKQMISAMTYPAVIFVIAIGVVIFILVGVVPSFVSMFESQGTELPAITVFVINSSEFLKNYWIYLVSGVIILGFVFKTLFTSIKEFRTGIQTFLMKLPIVGNIIIYNEVANFTKTFASLLNHNVFITDSMQILSRITSNEVYIRIINNTLVNLSKGAKISDAFRNEWAFPIVAFEMLQTGESTGQLGLMMEKVADHYQMLHKNAVSQIKSLIEPIMIGILAVVAGGIVLAIVIPMFAIYNGI